MMSSAVNTAVSISVGLCLGLLAGHLWFGEEPSHQLLRVTRSADCGMKVDEDSMEKNVTSQLLNSISSANIKENLRFFSSRPRLARTAGDRELAGYIRDLWTDQGLDVVNIHSYNVLLSFPDSEVPNTVGIVDHDGRPVFTSFVQAESPELSQPYNAFSPDGHVQGDLVYVNYARPYDFDLLADYDVDVRGKVLIARYGWIFRGNKLMEAQTRGAAGLILYSDPEDYNGQMFSNTTSVFPESWWLPGEGVQRGNVVLLKGDQLTPGYPATEHAYRLSEEAVRKQLPQILCQPIGYKDARELLRRLGGRRAPSSWQGGLDIPYRLGPGFKHPDNSSRVSLHVNNRNRQAVIDNVVGRITGATEPDRYVVLGCHRDAWGFGAVDPGSGQATLLEVVRGFSHMLQKGWRPRRTILFCSWGGEESGLIGSTEWVEEFSKTLHGRIVSYHNLDSAVVGNFTLNGRATPSLRHVLMKATQQVPDPEDPSCSVYDTWRKRDPDGDQPWIPVPGSGSDFAPFVQSLGVPVTDHAYIYNWNLGISSYPLYHTGYDVMKLMEFIDPDYRFCRAVGQIAAHMVRHLADTVVLNLNMEEYARSLRHFTSRTWRRLGSKLEKNHISFSGLRSAVANFSQAATDFHKRLQHINTNNSLEVRRYNDQLMLLERAFTDPAGLPGRPLYRHLVFSPSSIDHYSGAAFSGLYDLLYNSQDTAWEDVKKHLAAITYVIQSAALTLMSDTP